MTSMNAKSLAIFGHDNMINSNRDGGGGVSGMTRSCIWRLTGRHGDSTGQVSDSWEDGMRRKPLNLYPALNKGGMMYMTERTVEHRGTVTMYVWGDSAKYTPGQVCMYRVHSVPVWGRTVRCEEPVFVLLPLCLYIANFL